MSASTPERSDSHPVKDPKVKLEADSNHDAPSPSQRSGSISKPSLNPRSCVTCRRRKVRCDKKDPCVNCTKAGIECIFPGPGRAPRKARKPPDTELLSRLRRLEGVVQSLGAGVDEDGTVTQLPPPQNGYPPVIAALQGELRTISARESSDAVSAIPKCPEPSPIDKHLGRLVINEGRSRYVSHAFWASMGDEIAELRDILDESSSDADDSPSPDHSASGNAFSSHQGFIFGYASTMKSLRSLHPSPSQIFILWEVFKENVDPVVRILHRPTAKNILINAASNIDNLSKSAEALLFSIYFGAIVSLSPEQCQSLFGADKDQLINRYRFAVEQAFARADFLNSSSLTILQAFVFYLICVRVVDDTRMVWSLTGLALHLAQALGVHRDGTNFGLSPFETEMRRRLWWHVSILDTRSSEDHGTDPTFAEGFYDTKYPSNINDEDISPDMKEFPEERQGSTEMTFCLVRFELSATTRRMNSALSSTGPCSIHTRSRTIEEKAEIINNCHQKIDERYLQHCNKSVPIQWVCATVARLILAKMWLMAHYSEVKTSKSASGSRFSPDVKDRMFVTSVEVIEFSLLLEQNDKTAKWGWLFRTYMQWHAVAFVLAELIIRPQSADTNRAWKAVEAVYEDRVRNTARSQKGMLWKPMKLLMHRAKAVRAQQGNNDFEVLANGSQEDSPIAFGESSASPATQIRPHVGVVNSTAEALGLDLDLDESILPDAPFPAVPSLFPMDFSEPQPDYLAMQPNISDADIDQWLQQEQMAQQNPDFVKWFGMAGWGPSQESYPMHPPANNQFSGMQGSSMEGVQQWT